MKKSLFIWQLGGFVFAGIFGVLLHFLYDWTQQSIFIAPFSATNESTWEHMKLLFFPAFIFALIEYKFLGKDYKNYWCAKLFGILSGLLLIPILFYTYTGALGKSVDWFNIVIFFIAIGVTFYLEYLALKREFNFCVSSITAFAVLCLITLLFILFTFAPPQMPLFQEGKK